jgi:hypothetical protein
MPQQQKMNNLINKKSKNFSNSIPLISPRAKRSKSFLVLFFKKELLVFNQFFSFSDASGVTKFGNYGSLAIALDKHAEIVFIEIVFITATVTIIKTGGNPDVCYPA